MAVHPKCYEKQSFASFVLDISNCFDEITQRVQTADRYIGKKLHRSIDR